MLVDWLGLGRALMFAFSFSYINKIEFGKGVKAVFSRLTDSTFFSPGSFCN